MPEDKSKRPLYRRENYHNGYGEAVRPPAEYSKFDKLLPWIAISLLVAGLGISRLASKSHADEIESQRGDLQVNSR